MHHNVVVVGGNRIPFAKAGGPYAQASAHDMLTAALDGLIARTGLSGTRVGEVAAGAVLKHPNDFNLTREAVLSSALAPETPACDLQQACATASRPRCTSRTRSRSVSSTAESQAAWTPRLMRPSP